MTKPETKVETIAKLPKEEPKATSKVGTFITVNSRTITGLRINLEKIRTYAYNDAQTIGFSWDNGTQTILSFASPEQAKEVMDQIDSQCL
jgi:hypothetical protein